MRDYPQFSFWILITLVEICFSRIFKKPPKNRFELVGTVLKKSIKTKPCMYSCFGQGATSRKAARVPITADKFLFSTAIYLKRINVLYFEMDFKRCSSLFSDNIHLKV